MLLPSKNTSFSDSIIAKFSIVLSGLMHSDMTASELFRNAKDATEDIGEFIKILDCLYALGKLELNAETRYLHYVG